MLFELLIVPLPCKDCECTTDHLVRFIYYNGRNHTVKIQYYCQDCFDLAHEKKTSYLLTTKDIEFKLYYDLCKLYGETKFP